MARDRQQAKRRQAERRAARLREREAARDTDGAASSPAPADSGIAAGAGGSDGTADPAPDRLPDSAPTPDPAAAARLAAAAPPEATGRSDTVVESPPPAPQIDAGDETAPATRQRPATARDQEHGRVVGFLVAVWAELKRVQWPDRRTLITLTGVVLGFVLVAGGYLGALDAIFSRLIQAIL